MVNLKNYLGYDRLEMNFGEEFVVSEEEIKGSLWMLARTNTQIQGLFLQLNETYSYGWWKNKKKREFDLGKKAYHLDIHLKKNEKYKLNFNLPIERIYSKIEDPENFKMLGRWVGSVLKLAGNAQSTYILTAQVKLKGSPVKAFSKKTFTNLNNSMRNSI